MIKGYHKGILKIIILNILRLKYIYSGIHKYKYRDMFFDNYVGLSRFSVLFFII